MSKGMRAMDNHGMREDVSNRSFVIRLLVAVAASLVASLVVVRCLQIALPFFVADGSRAIVALRIVLFFAIALLPLGHLLCGPRFMRLLHDWRWALGGLFVAACTALKISGTSMNVLNGWYGSGDINASVIFGTPRPIRTDEFGVGTMFAFSQNYDGYSQFNSYLGGVSSTDVAVIKDAPAWCLAEIFRPFQWGYLVFGSERGLAFWWSARLAVLFLISYEFFRLVTRGVDASGRKTERRGISAVCVVLITFSPMVQWWFAVNGIVEMIVAAFGSVVCLNAYLHSHDSKIRLLWSLAIAEFAGMFAWVLYPAWQVPLAWIIVFLAVWLIATNWGTIRMTKIDWIAVICVAVAFVGVCLAIAYASRDALAAELDTVYPGSRRTKGGESGLSFLSLFGGTGSQAFFAPSLSDGNKVEPSRIADFWPLGCLLVIANCIFNKRGRKFDGLSMGLMGLGAFLCFYSFAGIPRWLANITLLSMSQDNRAVIALGVVNVILIARAIAQRQWKASFKQSVVFSLAFACVFGYYAVAYGALDTKPQGKFTLALLVLLVVEYFAMAIVCTVDVARTSRGALPSDAVEAGGGVKSDSASLVEVADGAAAPSKKGHAAVPRRLAGSVSVVCAWLVALMALGCGLCVNPVQRGVAALTEQPIVVAMEDVQRQEPGMVITLGTTTTSSFLANAMGASGIQTINTTQVTPRWTLWNTLDPTRECQNAYNRYAHIAITVTSEDAALANRMGNPTPDMVSVALTPDEMHELGAVYVTSETDLTDVTDGSYGFEKVSDGDGHITIWKLVSADER